MFFTLLFENGIVKLNFKKAGYDMKRRLTLFYVVIILFTGNYFAQGIVNLIKSDSLNKYVRDLSGDKTFHLNGVPQIIKTRNTTYASSDINTAAMYIKSKFEYFGLTAYEQPFTFSSGGTTYNAKNIYAVQTGTDFPNKKYVICAHYDSMPANSAFAPGADDNASGSAAVIEAARVLSTLNPKYTIVYALWSGEEQGLKGSKYFANKAATDNEDILGVLNLDMIAWDKNGDNYVDIECKNLSSAKQPLMTKLLDMFSTANQLYNINMTLSKYNSTGEYSDHYPFLEKDYPAVLMIEASNDFNTEYHKVTDTFSNMNIAYFEKCSKLAICTLAELARTTNALGNEDMVKLPADFALHQNYPNPFNPATVITYRIADGGFVKLRIFDAIGREVKTLVDEFQPAGEHSVRFSVADKTITSGVYFYTLQAGNRFFTKKMVYLK